MYVDQSLIMGKIHKMIVENKLDISLEHGVQFRRILYMCKNFKYLNQKLPEFRNTTLLIEICKVPRIFNDNSSRNKINKFTYLIFNLLIKSGFMTNFVDDDNRSAIFYLLLNYDGTKVRKKMIQKIILKYSADLDHLDFDSLTPLLYVCYTISKLVTDKNEIMRNKYYPIHELINLILKYKDIKSCKKELRLSLHYLKNNIFTKVKYTRQATRKIHSVLNSVGSF